MYVKYDFNIWSNDLMSLENSNSLSSSLIENKTKNLKKLTFFKKN